VSNARADVAKPLAAGVTLYPVDDPRLEPSAFVLALQQIVMTTDNADSSVVVDVIVLRCLSEHWCR